MRRKQHRLRSKRNPRERGEIKVSNKKCWSRRENERSSRTATHLKRNLIHEEAALTARLLLFNVNAAVDVLNALTLNMDTLPARASVPRLLMASPGLPMVNLLHPHTLSTNNPSPTSQPIPQRSQPPSSNQRLSINSTQRPPHPRSSPSATTAKSTSPTSRTRHTSYPPRALPASAL